MSSPELSEHFAARHPSAVRLAHIEYLKRSDGTEAINTAIGNVSLPMHPAMQRRMFDLGGPTSPFRDGVVAYSATVGFAETHAAFRNVIAASDCDTDDLHVLVTDGGSQAMELVIIGTCGQAGSDERPLLLVDPAYVNYHALATRVGRKTVSVERTLGEDGQFTLPDLDAIDACIAANRPGALVVIPYDNPTGEFFDHATMVLLARLCVKHDIWFISDEAYRELLYVDTPSSSAWRITEEEAPGITGRRLSIETASKMWNACGLRIGALVTDSQIFHEQALAEYTSNLCANAIGQWVFGALAHESVASLKGWFAKQRAYYAPIATRFAAQMRESVPGIIVSSPDAALYSVVDVRNVVKPKFNAELFVTYCATEGTVVHEGHHYTVLVAPLAGFYQLGPGEENPGSTQMRVAYVETPERMELVPQLFAQLLRQYEARRRAGSAT